MNKERKIEGRIYRYTERDRKKKIIKKARKEECKKTRKKEKAKT
jgi:hypothetical protein